MTMNGQQTTDDSDKTNNNNTNSNTDTSTLKKPATQVSSDSLLDSFLMDLPEPSVYQNPINSINNIHSDTFDPSATGVADPLAAAIHVRTTTTATTTPSMILPNLTTVAVPTSAAAVISNNSVPEFLFQLTKMLTEDNREVIEWNHGRIEVHSPHKLESDVLSRYFRHSKFASFQRQLNYFGFRKLAGKGKMAPCSYVNEAVGDDIGSLMLIKRKTGPPAQKDTKPIKTSSRRSRSDSSSRHALATTASSSSSRGQRSSRRKAAPQPPQPKLRTAIPPLKRPLPAAITSSKGLSTAAALAKQAVGRGVRHSITTSQTSVPSQTTANLTALEQNYRSTLNAQQQPNDIDDTAALDQAAYNNTGLLSRNSSLVDLAMLDAVQDDKNDTTGFGFVDFPHPEVHPAAQNADPDDTEQSAPS